MEGKEQMVEQIKQGNLVTSKNLSTTVIQLDQEISTTSSLCFPSYLIMDLLSASECYVPRQTQTLLLEAEEPLAKRIYLVTFYCFNHAAF